MSFAMQYVTLCDLFPTQTFPIILDAAQKRRGCCHLFFGLGSGPGAVGVFSCAKFDCIVILQWVILSEVMK